MKDEISIIIGIVMLFFFVILPIAGYISDVLVVNDAVQKSLDGDIENATEELADLTVKKVEDEVNNLMWAPFVGIFLAIITPILAFFGIKI